MSQRGRPRKDGAPLELVSAKVSPELYRALQRIAKHSDLTISEVVRRILVGRLAEASVNYGLPKIESRTVPLS